MTCFSDFGLSKDLHKSLHKMNYKEPTPIQAQAIPLAIEGHDILGSAQTGTGKTAAFSIPLVESVLRSPKGSALVLTPTRELAKQVMDVIHDLLGHESHIKTAFIIGGERYDKQMRQLRAKPRIVVGTPGRVNDHLKQGTLSLKEAGFLVLDETDRMLDMGFGVQLDKIIEFLPLDRQTLMFSATLPKGIIALSNKYLLNPKRVSVGETNVVAQNIEQEVLRIEQPEKYKELVNQLNSRDGSVIVFVKTKHGADKMALKLRKDGFTSEALHGDLRQNKRDKVMRNFREKNFRILIATDIAARGLDVPHIEHVINHDLPQVPEDFIHRMGRTARAGAHGSAISFVASHESRVWHAIELLLDPNKKREKFDSRPAPRKNKSRRKPYHGRPGSKMKKSENNEAHAEKRTKDDKPLGAPQKKKRKPKVSPDEFVKAHKPKNKQGKKPRKFAGKKSPYAGADGSAPLKRRSKNKPHRRAA